MFEQTKLFFKNLGQEISQKFDNFLKTGDFNMKNPQIALSTTEFEQFSVTSNKAREELLNEDGVEVVFAPANTDLECLKYCLQNAGYEDGAINEANLKAGILSFLRYSPYIINKHLDMKHGLAYLFRKSSGETYYMILKPETEHGSILLFENHYMVVKNLPQPFRQMQASFKAKIFNMIFGMLIPDLGFNESFFFHRDQFFSDDQFEDAEHVENFLLKLVKAYRRPYFGIMTEEEIETEKIWHFNRKLKNSKHLVRTQSNIQLTEMAKMFDRVSAILNGFAAVRKLKNDRALYGCHSFEGYNLEKKEYPESFYPLCLRKVSLEKKKKIDQYMSNELEEILVPDLNEEIEFFLPSEEEDRWIQNGFLYEGNLLFVDRMFYFKESKIVFKDDLPFEYMKLNRLVNYVTEEKFVSEKTLNIFLSPKIYSKLYELPCPMKCRINNLEFEMLNCCERNLILDYIRLCEPKLDNIKNSEKMIVSVYFQAFMAALVKKKQLGNKIKGDVNSFIKPIKFEGTMYQLPGYRILIDQYIYSSDMQSITHMGLKAYILSCPEALKFLKKKKVKYTLKQKGNKTEIHFIKMDLTIEVNIKIQNLIYKPSDLNFCELSFGELRYWKENDKLLCHNKWFDTIALISHFDRYCCDSAKYRYLVKSRQESDYDTSKWQGGIF